MSVDLIEIPHDLRGMVHSGYHRAVRAGVEIYPCYDGENVCYVGRIPFIRGD
ncbi:hypothetical protein J7K99_00365 [bacterium]|nr:hypothetical protein [bacterium]